MSSLHAGSPYVHADVEKDHVDRDSEPGSEDSDINVDSNSEIKFCLNVMSMEKALQSATAKVEAGSGNWKWTNLTCTNVNYLHLHLHLQGELYHICVRASSQ